MEVRGIGKPMSNHSGCPLRPNADMNNPRTLSDGSVITTTVGYTEDRTGFAYREAIEPDERLDGEQALEAARRWVSEE